jgi:hypothetical protein
MKFQTLAVASLLDLTLQHYLGECSALGGVTAFAEHPLYQSSLNLRLLHTPKQAKLMGIFDMIPYSLAESNFTLIDYF